MQREPLELTEYQPSRPYALSAEDIAGLRRLLGKAVTIEPSPEQPGGFVITPGGVAGTGEIAERLVTVEPKISIRRLLFLISYSLDPTGWRETYAGFQESSGLFSSVVPGFVSAVQRATARGVLRGYQERREPLSTVRGRIEFDRLIKQRQGVFPPIDCRYDEYSADIEENRVLLATANRLSGLRHVSARWQTELRRVSAAFSEVTLTRYRPRSVPRIPYTQLNEHYRPAVEIGRLVLRGLAVEVGGEVSSRGFFVDTAALFEDFVVTALREALGLSEHIFPQQARGRPLHLDRGRRIKLEPDLSWWEGERCVFVGDAKYKRTPPTSGVKNPDLYQLLAYAQATGLDTGFLIYADGIPGRETYEISGSSKVLEVLTLDLDREPDVVLDEMMGIAEAVSSVGGSRASLLPSSRRPRAAMPTSLVP